MHIPIFKRIIIMILNIVFPPIAVGMLTGFGSPDTFMNCLLFLLAIIPSHIHGFYVSFVYFHRKRRVRRGKWPGGDKLFLHSERVVTGGAGYKEARRLKKENERQSHVSWKAKHDDFDSSSVNSSRRESRRSSRRVSRQSTQFSPVAVSPVTPQTWSYPTSPAMSQRSPRMY